MFMLTFWNNLLYQLSAIATVLPAEALAPVKIGRASFRTLVFAARLVISVVRMASSRAHVITFFVSFLARSITSTIRYFIKINRTRNVNFYFMSRAIELQSVTEQSF